MALTVVSLAARNCESRNWRWQTPDSLPCHQDHPVRGMQARGAAQVAKSVNGGGNIVGLLDGLRIAHCIRCQHRVNWGLIPRFLRRAGWGHGSFW